jgi:hypothetical protein
LVNQIVKDVNAINFYHFGPEGDEHSLELRNQKNDQLLKVDGSGAHPVKAVFIGELIKELNLSGSEGNVVFKKPLSCTVNTVYKGTWREDNQIVCKVE